MGNQPDYYAILGVTPKASAREITHAYRALLRRHHPDTASHDGGASPDADLQELHAIMQAYVVLSDSEKRSAYDHGRVGAGSGTPVKVRIHRTAAETEPADRLGQPLSLGPTRWTPSRRDPRRPT